MLQDRVTEWTPRAGEQSLFKVMFGEGRRLFANHFFTQADVYFHGGYYPSIFDRSQQPRDTRHMQECEEDHDHSAHEAGEHEEDEHIKSMAIGEPRDFLERFGRKFMIAEHTHLDGGNEREVLPWLRVAVELDPQQVDFYTVAAFWLRTKLGKADEAEKFLREGLRANPQSYEILFELGRTYNEGLKDPARARNVYDLALRRWHETQSQAHEPDFDGLRQIAMHLAELEENAGALNAAVQHLEIVRRLSPDPQAIQKQIDELVARGATPPAK